MSDNILRRLDIEQKTGLSERQIRNLEGEGKFPKRFLIAQGGRAIGWSEAEVHDWIRERIQLREQCQQHPGMTGAPAKATA